MLKSMRRHARYFYVLFVLVIVSFIFWGVGGVDNDSARPALVSIGEDRIYPDEYWRTYERNEQMMRELYPDKFDEKMREELKKRVLEEMVDQRVLLHAALQAGITVSDKELEESIVNDPSFTRQGGFDKNIYLRTLELNRLTPKMFEEMKRNSLLSEKMARLVTESVDATPADLSGLKADDATGDILAQLRAGQKKEQALKSYIEGVKKRMNIEVNQDLIS